MASRWLGTAVALVLLSSSLLYPAIAQDNSTSSDPPTNGEIETIWGVVTLNTFGDRVPLISADYSVLTPVGADQLYSAGQTFRNRYITPSSTSSNRSIPGLSKYEINNRQIFNYGLYDVYVEQSAQAFLAGLYPPLNVYSQDGASKATLGLLANGSTVTAPLGGLQYPQLYSASDTDPFSYLLAGHLNCPAYEAAHADYFSTSEYMSTRSDTKNFYNGLANVTTKAIPDAYTLDYRSAYELWDYISYGVLHDKTTAGSISEATLKEARTRADSLTYALYGNSTANDGIRVMAGRTLAGYVKNLIMNNFYSSGKNSRMTNLFIGYEPMVSLFSLLGLSDYRDIFQAMPDLASSLVFELFSTNANGTYSSYPSFGDLKIRVLYSQGPATDGNLDPYPVLGNDRNDLHMPLSDFVNRLENMIVSDATSWCTICNSDAIFCAAVTNGSTGLPVPQKSGSVMITPPIAGVIGGLIALVLVGLVLLFAMLVFGVRFRRVKTKKRSELGGFKGSEKLASDADLPSTAMEGAGATVVPTAGHRRIESWELKEGGGRHPARKPSFEEDMTSLSQREGVKAVENV